MKVGDAFPGNWLRSSELGESDHVVTITEVRSEMVGQGQQAQLKLVIQFAEFDKPLVCNKTNATSIAKLYGDETEDWVGKQVILWVNPDITFGNEVVAAIRVRNKKPTAPVSLLSWQDALALCRDVGITDADLKSYLKQKGHVAYNKEKCTPLVRELVAGFDGVEPPQEDDTTPF